MNLGSFQERFRNTPLFKVAGKRKNTDFNSVKDDPEPWNPINDFSTPTYPNQDPVRTIQAVPTSNPAFQIESDQFNQIDDLPTYEQATREDQKGSVTLSPTSAAYTNQSFQS